MAPPSILASSYTTLLSIDTLDGVPWSSSNFTTIGPAEYNSGQARFRTSNILGDGYAEYDLDSAFDLSQSVVVFQLEHNFSIEDTFRIGFSSGATPNVNYRTWVTDPNNRLVRVQIILDPSYATDVSTSAGTFDPTDVRRIRIEVIGANSDRLDIFSPPFAISKTTGLIGVGGELGDELKVSTFTDWLTRDYYSILASQEVRPEITPIVINSEYSKIPVPCTFGDGSTATTILVKSAAFDEVLNDATLPLSVGALTHRVNLPSVSDITSLSIIASAQGTSFEDISPIANRYRTFFANGLSTISLGNADLAGQIENMSGLISGGSVINAAILDSTSSTVYEGTADLTGTEFNSPLANYYVDFGMLLHLA